MRKLVIIESPFRAKGWYGRWQNVRYARACLRDSLLRGEAPFASHLLYTQSGVLRDSDELERKLGIESGWDWMKKADLVAVYIDRGISGGMVSGEMLAHILNLPVEYRTLDK